MVTDLDIARGMAAAGIPVLCAYPDPEGKTPSGRATGYILPTGWQHTTANPALIGAWKPGMALIAVMGQGLDLVDDDPRNGGDIAALNGMMPEILAVAATPSGGYHFFVRSLGVRSRDNVLPGIDIKAGDPDAGIDAGRGFAFIAPTVRKSKVTGELAAYRWVKPPALEKLAAEDRSGEKLAALVRGRRETAGSSLFQQPASERKHAGPIYYGDRHKQLVSYAGWLRAKDIPLTPEAETLMLRRLQDCVPVLPDGSKPPEPVRPLYTEAEVLGKLRDIYRRYQADDPAAENGQPAAPGRQLILTRASDIEMEPVVWAWEDDGQGRIPSGSLGLFAGREGTGKSSFLIWLTAQITTGELPGMFRGKPRAVIYVAVEDSWKYTIAPRLVAAGADLTIVYRAEVQVVEGDTVSLSLPADNKLLEDAINARGVAMVALDPLMSAISDALDTHVNRQVRQALDPLSRLADRTGAIIAGIAHFNKSGGTDASSLITASGAFKDSARFIFAFAGDEDGTKVITQTKNSLGRNDLPSMAYRLINATVPTAKGDANVGRFVVDGPSERTVRDIMRLVPGGGADRGRGLQKSQSPSGKPAAWRRPGPGFRLIFHELLDRLYSGDGQDDSGLLSGRLRLFMVWFVPNCCYYSIRPASAFLGGNRPAWSVLLR